VLDGSTCARQNPVSSAGPDRWRCGGRLGRHAVSRVPVTSAPTIAHACNSSHRGSAFPRRAVLAILRCVTRPKTPPSIGSYIVGRARQNSKSRGWGSTPDGVTSKRYLDSENVRSVRFMVKRNGDSVAK